VPHQKLTSTGGVFGDFSFQAASFRHVPAHCKFVALMPQWDFLDFLTQRARQFSGFDLRMEHEAVDLLQDSDRIVGIQAQTPEGAVRIHADLVVGCDGRHARTRSAAQFEVREYGVPIDVLWFRIGRQSNDPEQLFGNFNYGKALILINRGDYFQAGFIIRKGSFDEMKRNGMENFRKSLLQTAPFLGDRIEELQDWDQIKLLSVQINRLRRWYRPGLLCIGDAAHAMSPVGGVGINLAIQDAVATANLLARPLLQKRVTEALMARVQQRRELPTRATQFLQVNAHRQLEHVFANPGPAKAPWQLKTAVHLPGIQDLMGRVIGIGVRPEHVAGAKRELHCNKPSLKTIAVYAGVAAAAAVTTFRIVRGFRRFAY